MNERITETEALDRFPALRRLVDIRQAGWRFVWAEIDKEPAIVGHFHWPMHTDALWILGESQCVAVRILDDLPGQRGGLVWEYEGSLGDAVQELLALPAPSSSSSPRLIRVSFPTLWRP